jgi:hypothetical protein
VQSARGGQLEWVQLRRMYPAADASLYLSGIERPTELTINAIDYGIQPSAKNV